jgi:hypothetical protein
MFCEICRPSRWDYAAHKQISAPPLGTETCRICGEEFTKKAHHQRLCSERCKYEWKNKIEHERQPLCKCEGCGILFKPKKSDRMRFHSQECAAAYRGAKHNRIKDLIKVLSKVGTLVLVLRRLRECTYCGGRFYSTRKETCCSSQCRQELVRQYWRIRYQKVIRERAMQRHREKADVIRCYNCWKEFVPQFGSKRKRFCSTLCANRFEKRMRNRRRRARKWQTEPMFDRFSDMEIFERDGWICQICLAPIDRTVSHRHPMSATLDHIVPLSRCGTHTRQNVQTAHRQCNSLKRELLPSDLQLRYLMRKLRRTAARARSKRCEKIA